VKQGAVAAWIDGLVDWKVDASTISRLEKRHDPPEKFTQQTVAFLAALFYGFDPDELGLTVAMLPSRLRDLGFESLRDQAEQTLRCSYVLAGDGPFRGAPVAA
jgi:hypothetical protein